MAERLLNYKTEDEKVYFYYGEKLLFQNDKSMPFIVLKKLKDGVRTSTSLFKFLIKETEKGYSVSFFGAGKIAIVNISCTNNIITVDIQCDEEYDLMNITLPKKKNKVYGLPTYKQKKPKQTILDKIFHKAVYYPIPDKKLTFFKSGVYLFDNVNMTDYTVDIKDNIFISTKTKNPSFNLFINDDINNAAKLAEKENPKITKYKEGSIFLKLNDFNEEKIDGFCLNNNTDIKGIIIKPRVFSLPQICTEVNKCNKKNIDIIFSLNKIINTEFAEKYFDKGEYDNFTNNLSLLNFNKKETIQKYMIIIRKYLDAGVSGIYFDGMFSKKEMLEIKNQLKTVLMEYPKCTIFHSTITEGSSDFGYYIIKNKGVITNFDKFASYYLYSAENKLGKEEEVYRPEQKFPVNIVNIE